jgi:hypothetical protein
MLNPVLMAAMTMAMLAAAAAQTSSSAPVPGTASGSTTATATVSGTTRILTVDALEAMDLVGADGRKIGAIEGVVENTADNTPFALVRRGGLLGFGAREIAIPLENLAVQSGKVTLRNMDTAQLNGTPEFNNSGNAYRRLDATQQISLAQLR